MQRKVTVRTRTTTHAKTGVRAAIAAVALAATALVPTSANAEPGRTGVDWMRVLVELDLVARRGADVLDTPRCTDAGCYAPAVALHSAHGADPNPHNAGNAWFGVAPTVSLVARDWGSAFKVAGDRLALVDAMRITSSTRMVLSRVRLNGHRITPFAQLGVGQWRIDPYLMPLTPRQTEIAAQLGGGVEMRLLPQWQLALETTATVIYRDDRQPVDAALPRMWSTMLASRFEF